VRILLPTRATGCIMLINPENLRVDQHVFIGDLTLINTCSP